MIKEAKQAQGISDELVMDVHPDRPVYRGIALPEHIISLEADPTFEELSGAGAVVDKQSEAHTVLDDMFLISGEIPRVTPYETGLRNAVRFDPEEKDWYSDEVIADERFLVCNLKGMSTRSYQSDQVLNPPRQRACGLHRLQPRRRSQHRKARRRPRLPKDPPPHRGRRLPPRHERRSPDPKHSLRPEKTRPRRTDAGPLLRLAIEIRHREAHARDAGAMHGGHQDNLLACIGVCSATAFASFLAETFLVSPRGYADCY